MEKFLLMNTNPSYEFWQGKLARWYREYKAGKKDVKLGRSPSIGDEIDKKLVKVVEHYNAHGVPIPKRSGA